MAKSTTASQERTRPSSRLQPQSLLDSTPVLFRLPTIQVTLREAPEETIVEAPECNENVSSSESLSIEPARPAVNERSKQTTDFAESETGCEPGLRSTIESRQEPRRSWWEHWSSGVIVILLLMAMITVILLIIRNPSNTAQRTNDSQSFDDDFGDLELITVPTFEIVAPSVVAETQSESSRQRQDDAAKPEEFSELGEQLANVDIIDTLERNSTPEVNAEGLATASLMEPTPMIDSSSTAAPNNESSLASEAKEAKSTGAPFPDLPVIAGAIGRLGIEQSLVEQPEIQQPEIQQPGDPSSPLQAENLRAKPSVDSDSDSAEEALLALEAMMASAEDSPAANQEWSDEENDQSTSALLSSSMPNIGGPKSSIPATAKAVSNKKPSQEVEKSEAASSNVRATATPESNEEEIIRAYLELIRTQRNTDSSKGEAVNRYQGLQ